MDSARELYNKLKSFKEINGSSQTPELRLMHYLTQILGSVENYHIDYKEKQDRSKGILGEDDKKNLAKAVSGFANSGGGVLLWGIQDKNLSPKPINNVQSFVSALINLAPKSQTLLLEVLRVIGFHQMPHYKKT